MNKGRKLLIRSNGSEWIEPESSAYKNEAHLQEILASDPSQIPGVEAGALSATELTTDGGYVDVCVVGRDGSIVVVECKLATNSERRRMVIGQVVDYAAAIWSAGADAFLDSWSACTDVDLTNELDDAALQALRSNIGQARIDLCLAVDSIDDDLRRLVEYLNRATADEVSVTSLQLSYSKHGDVEILIPTTFGGELAEAKSRKAKRSHWTVDSFVTALGTEVDQELARELLNRVERSERLGEKPPLWFGVVPGGGIYIYPHGLSESPLWLSINKDDRLMMSGSWNWFENVRNHPGFEPLAQFLGLDHMAPTKGLPVADFDLDGLWTAIVQTSLAINEVTR